MFVTNISWVLTESDLLLIDGQTEKISLRLSTTCSSGSLEPELLLMLRPRPRYVIFGRVYTVFSLSDSRISSR